VRADGGGQWTVVAGESWKKTGTGDQQLCSGRCAAAAASYSGRGRLMGCGQWKMYVWGGVWLGGQVGNGDCDIAEDMAVVPVEDPTRERPDDGTEGMHGERQGPSKPAESFVTWRQSLWWWWWWWWWRCGQEGERRNESGLADVAATVRRPGVSRVGGDKMRSRSETHPAQTAGLAGPGGGFSAPGSSVSALACGNGGSSGRKNTRRWLAAKQGSCGGREGGARLVRRGGRATQGACGGRENETRLSPAPSKDGADRYDTYLEGNLVRPQLECAHLQGWLSSTRLRWVVEARNPVRPLGGPCVAPRQVSCADLGATPTLPTLGCTGFSRTRKKPKKKPKKKTKKTPGSIADGSQRFPRSAHLRSAAIRSPRCPSSLSAALSSVSRRTGRGRARGWLERGSCRGARSSSEAEPRPAAFLCARSMMCRADGSGAPNTVCAAFLRSVPAQLPGM